MKNLNCDWKFRYLFAPFVQSVFFIPLHAARPNTVNWQKKIDALYLCWDTFLCLYWIISLLSWTSLFRVCFVKSALLKDFWFPWIPPALFKLLGAKWFYEVTGISYCSVWLHFLSTCNWDIRDVSTRVVRHNDKSGDVLIALGLSSFVSKNNNLKLTKSFLHCNHQQLTQFFADGKIWWEVQSTLSMLSPEVTQFFPQRSFFVRRFILQKRFCPWRSFSLLLSGGQFNCWWRDCIWLLLILTPLGCFSQSHPTGILEY